MSDTAGQNRKRKSQRRFEQINHIVDSVICKLPSVSQRLLLLVCWRFANPKGEFQVSMVRLAKTTGICHRQVRRAFDSMIDIGALQVVTPRHGRRATVYRITGEPRS